MNASPLDELLAKIARLETQDAEKDKRLADLARRVLRLEGQLREAALERSRLAAITTQLVLAVWALREDSAGSPTGALSEDARQACKTAAFLLKIPLAA